MKRTKVKKRVRTQTNGQELRGLLTSYEKEIETIKSGDLWYGVTADPSYQTKSIREIKRDRHHQLIHEMRAELALAKAEIENTARSLASDLHSTINLDLQLIETKCQYVKDLKIGPGPQVKNNLDVIWKEATKISYRRKNATESFHKMLVEIEESRQKRVTAILDKFQELFVKNDYLGSRETTAFFDFEIMTVNDEKSKNVFKYGDICNRFNRITDEYMNTLKSLCEEKSNLWEEYLVSNLKYKFKSALQFNLGDTCNSEELNNLQKSFVNKLQEFSVQWIPLDMMFTHHKTYQSWFESIESILDSLDHLAVESLHEYKSLLDRQYTDCEESVREVQEMIVNSGFSCQMQNEKDFQELFQSLLKTLKNETLKVIDDFKVEHGKLIFCLLEELDSVKEIFSAAEDFKLKYNESLIDMQNRHFILLSSHEQVSLLEKDENDRIEAMIGQIKVASNIQTVDIFMEEIKNIYEGKKSRLQESYNKTIRILDTFIESLKSKYDLLSDEVKNCVRIYEDKSKKQLNSIEGVNSVLTWKPSFLSLMENEIAIVRDSKTRIFDILKSEFPSKTESTCFEKANVWILTIRQTLRKDFESNLSALSNKYECFLNDIYSPRIVVLQEHVDFFKTHEQTVKKIWLETQVELENVRAKLSGIYEKSNAWFDSMHKRSTAVHSFSSLQVILTEMNKEKGAFKRGLNDISKECIQLLCSKEDVVTTMNFEFLHNLLVLEEEKLYTSDEIDEFSSKLFEMEKEVALERQSLKANVLRHSSNLADELTQRTETLVESLRWIETDLKFSEKILSLIRESKSQLKMLAFSLKCSGKLLSRQIEELSEALNKNILWPDSAVNIVLDRWATLLNGLIERKGCLLDEPEETWGMAEAFMIGKMEEISEFPSYVGKLCCLNSKNYFLYKVFDVLRKSVEDIEGTAKEYYVKSNSRLISTPNYIHKSYNDLMNEVIYKYNFYIQQCQFEWFRELSDFVDVVAVFKEGMNCYIARLVPSLTTAYSGTVEKLNAVAREKLKTIQSQGTARILEIATFLKPAHGLPENELLLNNLQAYFDEALSRYEQMSEETVQKYTIEGEEILVEASTDLRSILVKLKTALKENFEKNLLQNAVKEIVEVCEKLSIQKTGVCNVNGTHPDCSDRSSPNEGSNLNSACYGAMNSQIDVCQIANIKLRLMTLSDEKVVEISTRDCRNSEAALVPLDFDATINKCLEGLQEVYTRTINELKHINAVIRSSIKEARFAWDVNVHSIKDMFTLVSE